MDAFAGSPEDYKQLICLLSQCTSTKLVEYSQSHLFVNEDGGTADIDMAADTEAKKAWVAKGWRYNLQDNTDKSHVAGYLDDLKPMERVNGLQQAISGEKMGWVEIQFLAQYVRTLIEFLIFELLMNSIRYDRAKERAEVHSAFEAAGDRWGQMHNLLVESCVSKAETEARSGEFSVQVENCICIIMIYLQEAKYIGKQEKEKRGLWGRELLKLVREYSDQSVALHISTSLPAWRDDTGMPPPGGPM